jgi:hypothetical protein
MTDQLSPPPRMINRIANYETFHPHVMACSDPIRLHQPQPQPQPQQQQQQVMKYTNDSNYDIQEHHPNSINELTQSTSTKSAITAITTTSLGAIAGSNGIVLFRWDTPHRPILILNHTTNATNNACGASSGTTTNTQLAVETTPSPMSSSVSSSSSHGGSITSLAFSPIPKHTTSTSSASALSIYLASTRGSSILIWDVSGHNRQPLQGRLSMTPSIESNTTTTATTTSNNNTTMASIITSMAWMPLQDSLSTNQCIVAATSSMAAIWEIQFSKTSLTTTYNDSTRTNTGTSVQRPYIRFADLSKYTHDTIPYRQIAVSCGTCNNHKNNNDNNNPTVVVYDCAILNAAGLVRIYNIRITSTTTSTSNSHRQHQYHHPNGNSIITVSDRPVQQLEACHYAGIGLSYISLNNNSNHSDRPCTDRNQNGWIIWGFDAPNTDAIVKVWMENSDNNNNDNETTTQPLQEYHLVGQCTTPHLACARVCPSPITNTFVTIGFEDPGIDGGSALDWRSDVWKVQFHDSVDFTESVRDHDNKVDCEVGPCTTLENVRTFHGASENTNLQSVLGGKELLPLRATEVTLTGRNPNLESKYDLVLCCLSQNGFITTHVRFQRLVLFLYFLNQ